MDIFRQGEVTIRLEIGWNGAAHAECPCCNGRGSHGGDGRNDPAENDRECRTCCGAGFLIQLPELDRNMGWTKERGEWAGGEIAPRLRVRQECPENGRWRISGPWENDAAEASTEELIRMAHTVLARLEPPSLMEKLEWVQSYRRLMSSATLKEATEAWEQRGPGSNTANGSNAANGSNTA